MNIKLVVNDRIACQANAIYGQDGGTSVNGEKWETITSYSPCPEPVQIKSGDRIKISSDYDLRQHKLYVKKHLGDPIFLRASH